MTDVLDDAIENFFASKAFGVVGASNNRNKFGNKVLRVYLQNHRTVYPVNPHENVIEGVNALKTLDQLPGEVESISIITPPKITEEIVAQAIEKGIKNIWMQPGAESEIAIAMCRDHGINIIAGGPCILVTLGFHETAD